MNRLTKVLFAATFLVFASGTYASVYRLSSLEPSYVSDRMQSQSVQTQSVAMPQVQITTQASAVSTASTSRVPQPTATPNRSVPTPTPVSTPVSTPVPSQPGAKPLVPTLFLSDGNGHTLTLGGNSSGVISFSGTLGQFSLSISTSAPTDQAMLPLLSLNSLSYFGSRSGTTTGTLTISLSETSLSSPGGTLTSKINGQTSLGSLSYSTFMDAGNNLFGKTTVLNTQGAFSGGSFAGTASAALSSHSPFSLTETIIIQQSTRGSTTFGAIVNDPPAPVALVPDTGSTLALLGLALLGIEAIRRRLRSA